MFVMGLGVLIGGGFVNLFVVYCGLMVYGFMLLFVCMGVVMLLLFVVFWWIDMVVLLVYVVVCFFV